MRLQLRANRAVWLILLLTGISLTILYINFQPELLSVHLGNISPNQIWKYRQSMVRDAVRHAWKGYVRDAWGYDEYNPLTRKGKNFEDGDGIGFMIVDCLDTFLIMDLKEEYQQSREWIATSLNFDQNITVSLFETTIRVLGGLLSAYHLSGNDLLYLEKAVDLGDRLLGAFDSPSWIPYPYVNLRTRKGDENSFTLTLAEAGSLQLEFKYLSHLTGDDKYWKKMEEFMFRLDSLEKTDGLIYSSMSPHTGNILGSLLTLGAGGDSYYEYLLKQYLQTNCTEPMYRRMYDEAMQGVHEKLEGRSYPSQYTFIGSLYSPFGLLYTEMEHLTCFTGGLFTLGSSEGKKITDLSSLTKDELIDLWTGLQITETCAQMYFNMPTGLAPEKTRFETEAYDGITEINTYDPKSLLRPEAIESLYINWKLVGIERYREYGWQIFQAFENYTRLEDAGYASLSDVTTVPPPKMDIMETFFLAETLKYFYLLFNDESSTLLPLDQYVFNTEAHPLPIFIPTPEVRGEGWSRQ